MLTAAGHEWGLEIAAISWAPVPSQWYSTQWYAVKFILATSDERPLWTCQGQSLFRAGSRLRFSILGDRCASCLQTVPSALFESETQSVRIWSGDDTCNVRTFTDDEDEDEDEESNHRQEFFRRRLICGSKFSDHLSNYLYNPKALRP